MQPAQSWKQSIRSIRKWCLPLWVLFFLVLLAASAGASVDKPASLSLKDVQGQNVRLSDLRGKIVVLNFWATWCGPCGVEMPLLMRVASSYTGKKVIVVGASIDDLGKGSRDKIRAYLEKQQIQYPIWIGASDLDIQRLRMGIAVPATAILDVNGVIRFRILGQMRPGELEERIDWLLSEQQGQAPPALTRHLDAQ
jgi:thiol-disulfide isomerase/thioredoxin